MCNYFLWLILQSLLQFELEHPKLINDLKPECAFSLIQKTILEGRPLNILLTYEVSDIKALYKFKYSNL